MTRPSERDSDRTRGRPAPAGSPSAAVNAFAGRGAATRPPLPSAEADRFDVATAALEPPLAVVDLDAFEFNAAQLLDRARGLPIRVATKSVRSRELLRRVLEIPGFSGLMCYSLREALWLWRTGLSHDIVVAYPPADRAALRELASAPEALAAITIVVDSVEHLDFIDTALGTATHPDIRLCLDIDASWRPLELARLHIGARRSRIRTPRHACALVDAVLGRPGFRVVGIMIYEAQIAGIPDNFGGLRKFLARWVRRRSAAELLRRRTPVVAAVRERTPLEFVNGGGTGSVELTAHDGVITEIAAGSGLMGPSHFDGYRCFQPRPAVLFALSVVRQPAQNIATLYSGGYVASGPASRTQLPRPYLPAGLRLTRSEGAGEVQTPVWGPGAGSLRLGSRVWLRHAKAGEIAEHFDAYHLVRDNAIVDTVPTYRGEGRNFA